MSNRYLFKAKHVHSSELNKHLDGKWVTGYLAGENYIADVSSGTEYLIDPATICQGTGYEDVFEGDLILYDEEVYRIIWSDKSLEWLIASETSSTCIPLGELNPSEIDVIGNVIDDPQKADNREDTRGLVGSNPDENYQTGRELAPDVYKNPATFETKWRCPRCKEVRKNNLGCPCCPNCGQALDWNLWKKEMERQRKDFIISRVQYMKKWE